MAMPQSGDAFAYCRSLEEEVPAADFRCLGFFSALASAIVDPNNCGYLHIPYGLLDLITEAD
jgi:hypothetical protein